MEERSKKIPPVLEVVCLFAAVITVFALAGVSGEGFFIARFDKFFNAAEPVPASASFAGIAERFGVSVITEGAPVPASYSADAAAPERIVPALTEISDFLERLPEGFTQKLAEGFPGGITIELTGELRALGEGYIDRPSALTFQIDGTKYVALDVNDTAPIAPTLAHELCHILDSRLSELALLDRSHWNDEDWAKLNPEGFRYYGAYIDGNGLPYYASGDASFTAEAGWDEIRFINRYSKTSATEDRAELIEALVRCPDAYFFESPYLKAKLAYYREAVKYYLGFDLRR